MGLFSAFGWMVVVAIVLFVGYLFVKFRYKKAGPDDALIIYGRRKLFGRKVRDAEGRVEGLRIVRGGGAFVIPAWEQ